MNTGQFGIEDVDELLEELPETFRSSQAVERRDVNSKRLGSVLTRYADRKGNDLYKVNRIPTCYSRHDIDLTHGVAKFGLDMLNKSIQEIRQNETITMYEIDHMRHLIESDELSTQIKVTGELKELLKEQYPEIEYDTRKQEFYSSV